MEETEASVAEVRGTEERVATAKGVVATVEAETVVVVAS